MFCIGEWRSLSWRVDAHAGTLNHPCTFSEVQLRSRKQVVGWRDDYELRLRLAEPVAIVQSRIVVSLVSNGSPAARADRDGQKIGVRVVSAGGWQRRVGRAENLSVRRGGRRCLCGACEPVSQHGAEGRHVNRGLLP